MKHRELHAIFPKRTSQMAASIVFLFSFVSLSMAIDCPPPPVQFDRDFRLELKGEGEIGRLLKLKLGSGEIDAVIEQNVHDLFSKYPDADKLVLQNWTLSMICQQLNESASLSDQEKLNFLYQLHQRVGNIFMQKVKTLSSLGETLKYGDPYERKAAIAEALSIGDPDLQHLALSEIFSSSRNFGINSTWFWTSGDPPRCLLSLLSKNSTRYQGIS